MYLKKKTTKQKSKLRQDKSFINLGYKKSKVFIKRKIYMRKLHPQCIFSWKEAFRIEYEIYIYTHNAEKKKKQKKKKKKTTVQPTKLLSDDKSGFRHSFRANVSLLLDQKTPADLFFAHVSDQHETYLYNPQLYSQLFNKKSFNSMRNGISMKFAYEVSV